MRSMLTKMSSRNLKKRNTTYLLPQIALTEYTAVQVWKRTHFFEVFLQNGIIFSYSLKGKNLLYEILLLTSKMLD